MSVRIRLTKTNDSKPERDIVLDQEVVSIGRDAGNTLHLPGTLVSKKHARIEGDGQAYRITDLRSTNATFVNDEKLPPERPHELHLGDRVRIGEYVVEILGFTHAPPKQEPVRQSPAQQDVAVASGPTGMDLQLARVAEEYAKPAYAQQRAQLKQMLADILGKLESSDMDTLASTLKQVESERDRLKEENRRLQEALERVSAQSRQPAPAQPIQPVPLSSQRLVETTKILLDAFSKLLRGRSSFRNEFLGATMIVDGELSSLLSADTAIQSMLDGSVLDEEFAARSAALQRELDEFIAHVVALLDGYRTSVDDGVHKLLQKMSPEVFRSQLSQLKLKMGPVEIPYSVIPFFLQWKTMQLSARMHQELTREDRGVLEKRYFRTGFIHGYDKCIASLRGSPRETREK